MDPDPGGPNNLQSYNTGFCIRIALKPTYYTNLTQPQVTAFAEVGNLKLTVLHQKTFLLRTDASSLDEAIPVGMRMQLKW
jgi:hypothetical protein